MGKLFFIISLCAILISNTYGAQYIEIDPTSQYNGEDTFLSHFQGDVAVSDIASTQLTLPKDGLAELEGVGCNEVNKIKLALKEQMSQNQLARGYAHGSCCVNPHHRVCRHIQTQIRKCDLTCDADNSVASSAFDPDNNVVDASSSIPRVVTQDLEFSGDITVDDLENNRDALTNDIAEALSVDPDDVTIISITEVTRRRRLLSKTIVVVYEVKVENNAAATSTKQLMENSSFKNSILTKVEATTGKSLSIVAKTPVTNSPTPAPTEAPTPAPTPAPTEGPKCMDNDGFNIMDWNTDIQTQSDCEDRGYTWISGSGGDDTTEAPTPAPTEAPTPAPTEAPTPAPCVDDVAQDLFCVEADAVARAAAIGCTGTHEQSPHYMPCATHMDYDAAMNPPVSDSGSSDSPILEIVGVMDGTFSSNNGKFIHLVANADIADLSIFGYGVANNGDTDGQEKALPSMAVNAGDNILITRYKTVNELSMTDYLGSCASQFQHIIQNTDDVLTMNGDDPIELYENGVMIDIYGEFGVRGRDEPWEYEDSWAYKENGTWTYGGVDCLNGAPETTIFDSNCVYAFCIASGGDSGGGVSGDDSGEGGNEICYPDKIHADHTDYSTCAGSCADGDASNCLDPQDGGVPCCIWGVPTCNNGYCSQNDDESCSVDADCIGVQVSEGISGDDSSGDGSCSGDSYCSDYTSEYDCNADSDCSWTSDDGMDSGGSSGSCSDSGYDNQADCEYYGYTWSGGY